MNCYVKYRNILMAKPFIFPKGRHEKNGVNLPEEQVFHKISMEELAEEYYLSYETIRKIVYK